MDKLVSVIIPTFNREKTIARAIQSVLDQNYSNIEILVCDDKSTDNTAKIVNEIREKNSNVRYLLRTDERKGANAVRNLGIENATGDYIAFLDSDDVLNKDSIINRVRILDNNSDIWLVYGDVLYSGSLICYDKIQEYDQKRYLMEELSLCCFITIMIRKEAFKKMPLLDMDLKSWQDDSLILMVDYYGMKMFHCGYPVANILGIDSKDRISVNYYNHYISISKLVHQYKRNIIKIVSYKRYLLWQLRIVLNLFRYKKSKSCTRLGQGFYGGCARICNKICEPFFRHIWG